MQNNKENRIRCEIDSVVISKEAYFFIVVQLKNTLSQQNVKYRTQTSFCTNRPTFKKNLFHFLIEDNSYTFKFGLMAAKSQLDKDATNAMVQGVCSIPLNLQRLKELEDGMYKERLTFTDRGKEVGQFMLVIQLQKIMNQIERNYDPFVSRVLYNEDCSDPVRLENNIKILQNKLEGLFESYRKIKQQENYFEKIYLDLEHDEVDLKTEIDTMEKVNSKIERRLDEKESLQNLKIQISILEQTEEGKKLLFQKLEYFQDRIYRQMEDYEKLNLEYTKIKPIIDNNIKKAEEQAQKLKGKQIQEFQLSNNQKILTSYDDLIYQFKCYEETIKSLMKMSSKSELTAQQAKLLLSQVSYEIKLSQYENLRDQKQNIILEQIEREIVEKAENQTQVKFTEEEEMIYKIKLSALEKEVQTVRQKIRKITKEKV